jgi:hypothetical protein
MRLGHCACAKIDELATLGAAFGVDQTSCMMMNDDDSLEGGIFGSTMLRSFIPPVLIYPKT